MTTRQPRTRREGFTIVEVLTVAVIVGILAGIAVPVLRAALYRADGTHVIADFHTVRLAATEYQSDSLSFPPTGQVGVTPPELVPYLPDNFDFAYKTATYRWRSWTATTPSGAQHEVGALEVRSNDPHLLDAIRSVYAGPTMGTSSAINLLID